MGIAIVLISLLTGLFLIFGAPSFLAEQQGSLAAAASYSFFHANLWHLCINSVAIWGLYARRKASKPVKDLAIAYVIAVLVSPLSALPPIGFSNVIYALIGLRTPAFSAPWWRRYPVWLFLGISAALIPFPQVSALAHLTAFAIAVGWASLRRFYLDLTADARKYL